MSHLLCSIVSGSHRGSLCLLVGVMQWEVALLVWLSLLYASDYTPESRSQNISRLMNRIPSPQGCSLVCLAGGSGASLMLINVRIHCGVAVFLILCLIK